MTKKKKEGVDSSVAVKEEPGVEHSLGLVSVPERLTHTASTAYEDKAR